MTAPAAASPSRAAIPRLVRTYLAPHWPGLAVSFALAGGIAYLTYAFMQLLQPAIDNLVADPQPGALWFYPAMIAGVGLLRGILLAIQLRLINRVGHTVVGEIQLDLFSRLVKADLRLQGAHSGQHVSSMLFGENRDAHHFSERQQLR